MSTRFHRHVLAALAAAVALVAVPTSASAAVITFDDITAPAQFGEAQPLTTQYSAQGVTFSGTGAVLDAVLSDFLLDGAAEARNILAYSGLTTIDFGGANERLSMPFDVLNFAAPLRAVSFHAGSGLNVGSILDVRAFNAAGDLLDSTSVELMAELRRVSLSGLGIARLEYGVDDEFAEFAIDNLNTTPSGDGAQVPEPMTLSLFATALGAAAFVRRRRN